MSFRQTVYAIGLCLGATLLALTSPGASLAADSLQPYVLGRVGSGGLEDTVREVKQALTGVGFEVVGEYSPYRDAHVIVATNDFLRKLAAGEPGGAYLAAQRISVARVGSASQVAYANPEYFRHAYRVKKGVAAVTAGLEKALGSEAGFGSKKGLTPSQLERYHYTFGMEYFDEPLELADYSSHRQAVRDIERNLAEQVAGVSKVYRIDAAGGEVTIFGVAMTEGMSSDEKIMGVVDVGDYRQLPHLPYEMVVFSGKVRALHPRFRIAVNFPDTKMVGAHSFAKITDAPAAIREALTLAAGGTLETDRPSRGGFVH